MTNDLLIRVSNISKEFTVSNNQTNSKSTFSALKNVSFDVCKGDVISIIGNNGSGKTTLLKILSNITKPTSGEVLLYGKSTSILDIGNNFHPDLTGRENILLQLKINRIKKEDFEGYVQQILVFSEIDAFFDQPIKYYSSGMFLRLAFSLAFHLAADILILDEVLSVGDEGFRLKCQELLKRITDAGKTIVFVSHNRLEILELSNKCIWLDRGCIVKTGKPDLLLREYFARHKDNFDGKKEIIETDTSTLNKDFNSNRIDFKWDEGTAPENEFIKIKALSMLPASTAEKIYNTDNIVLTLSLEKKLKDYKVGVFFFLQDVFYQSVLVGHFLNSSSEKDISKDTEDYVGAMQISCTIPGNLLMPGKYHLQLRFGKEVGEWNAESEELFRFSEKLSFNVHPAPDYVDLIGDLSKGSVRPKFEWTLKKQMS